MKRLRVYQMSCDACVEFSDKWYELRVPTVRFTKLSKATKSYMKALREKENEHFRAFHPTDT